MRHTPYRHHHIKSFTEGTSGAGRSASFPKVTGRLPVRAQTPPHALGLQSWGSPHFVVLPGLQAHGISGPEFQSPNVRSEPVAARAGAAVRLRWGRGGERGTAAPLGHREDHRTPGSLASRSAGELQAATADALVLGKRGSCTARC